jgi:hypothetical protein
MKDEAEDTGTRRRGDTATRQHGDLNSKPICLGSALVRLLYLKRLVRGENDGFGNILIGSTLMMLAVKI